jgi:hypothetical protein
METENKIEKHCSLCKYYYCYNASMCCSHPKKCGKITAKRKNGCKYFEAFNNKDNGTYSIY